MKELSYKLTASVLIVVAVLLSTPASGMAVEAKADVSLSPAGSFEAKLDAVKGEARLRGTRVEADKITIDLNSLKTGLSLRDKHAKEKYLETEKFPDAVLSDAKGENGKGSGKLRIHGIEKPVAGTYKIEGDKLIAEFPIQLSQFGIDGIKYMGVGVDDSVLIHVTVPLVRE